MANKDANKSWSVFELDFKACHLTVATIVALYILYTVYTVYTVAQYILCILYTVMILCDYNPLSSIT